MHKNYKLIITVTLIFVFGVVVVYVLKYSPFFIDYLFKKEVELKKTADSRVNILLLGIGGGTHDGPLLTDTIIFASIDPKTNKATLVSIPRDFWVPELDAKINTAYAFGEEKKEGGGLILAKAVVSDILDQPIDYAIRIDFSGFVKAVNLLGGLNINIERTFDDYEYPISGKENDTCGHPEEEIDFLATSSSQLEAFPCRYKHIHFNKGENHLNGDQALEYVRSRHALGPEGSDFARSRRQEKIIAAFKDKAFSAQVLLNPAKLINLYTILKESIDTDIKQEEFDDFLKLAQKMRKATIHSAVVDGGDSTRPGLLIDADERSAYKNQWVLIPRLGNGEFTEIQQYVACEIKTGNCPLVSPTPTRVLNR